MAPAWTPSPARVQSTRLTAFLKNLAARRGIRHASYRDLHRWSVTDLEAFWSEVWQFCGVSGELRGPVVEQRHHMPGARFFPGARLNFAENLLRRTDDAVAIRAESEGGGVRTLTFASLRRDVMAAAGALRQMGVQPGDRLAGVMANVPETVIAGLGAAAIGAVWSSCSPDFGVQGIVDRFGQIAPKVLITVDGYTYGGKPHDVLEKVERVLPLLPSVERVIVVPFTGSPRTLPGAVLWPQWLAGGASAPIETFDAFPFGQPLYILYSSGTTGVPKCIVHGAGGTLLQHLKEHQLLCDVRRDDRVFYFTTCGWMMWNWLVTALASGASLVLYDGAPFHPDGNRLFDLADASGATLFGVSAKFIDAARKAGVCPRRTHDLSTVRTITSTGSPLAPESFDYVYDAVKPDVHLASISGGTDIVSCFVGGNPNAPVWRGEIQAAALGMDVDVFDERGASTLETGELVCKTPFPSMPLGFWNDPEGRKYHAAYFDRFSGVWCHGDWVQRTDHGGFVIVGRSDATLNPGGVRIGTAEIYRQVEQLPEIAESLAVGQSWQGDERIVLFVRLAPGAVLDDSLRARIAAQIREHATPRHVPARIVEVPDLPRTKSGKLVELAVRAVIHGREVKNREALANPEALEWFRELADLAT